jgi:hypothetical protein
MTAKEKGQNANSDQQSNKNVLSNSTTNGAKAQILLTKYTSDKVLTKTYSTEGKKSGGLMTTGSMQIEAVENLEAFSQILESLKPINALGYGIPTGENIGKSIPVTTKKRPKPGHTTRTTDNFAWPVGAGVFLVDYDPIADGEILNKDELVAAIRQAMPELKSVKMLWLPSSSSYIFNGETKSYLSELKGQRLYFVIDRADKIPEIGEILFKRLWLNNRGKIEISKIGSLLEKSLIDKSVYQTQRLDFCGLAKCIPPMEKHKRTPEIIPGEKDRLFFDDVVKLTDHELQKYKNLVNTAKSVLKPKADKIKADRIEKEIATLCMAKPNIDKTIIRKQVEQAYNGGEIAGDFQIFVVDNGIETAVSVAEILSNPAKYHRMTCLDPLEPEYNDHSIVGVIYTDGKPNIHSQAHGGKTYFLKSDIEENDPDSEPVCFDDHALREFPADILPEVIRDYVLQTSQIRQVPVDMSAQIALSVLSTCLQKKFNVRVGKHSKQIEQLSLWTVTAMPPASRKSDTVKDLALNILNSYQQEESERMAFDVEKSKHALGVWEMEIQHLKQEKARTKDTAKKILLQQAIDRLATEKPVVLHKPVFVIGADVTPEGLTKELAKQKERMAIINTEGASFFQILAGRYSTSGETNLDPFLNSFCGDPVTVIRRNNDAIDLKKPALAIGITVQPDVLFKATANEDFNNRGLIGRFLCSIPKSLVGYRDLQTAENSQIEQQSYELLIKTLLNLPLPEVEQELLIDGEAFDFYAEHVYNPLEIGQRRGGEYEQIPAWAGKFAGMVARIAALFHIADDPKVTDKCISLDAVKRASKLIPYYEQHTKAALRLIGIKGEPTDAEKVLTWAFKAGKLETGFTLNEYFKAHRSIARTSDDLMPIFNTLTNRQILIDDPDKRPKSKGRRPEHFFIVNDKCIRCQKCFAPQRK